MDLSSLFSEGNINMLVTALLSVVLPLVMRLFFKDRAEAAEKLFAMGVEVAYNMVNDLAARTENKVDDKVALGLKFLNDFYAANGKKPSVVDEAKAKLLFAAMHGAEKVGK